MAMGSSWPSVSPTTASPAQPRSSGRSLAPRRTRLRSHHPHRAPCRRGDRPRQRYFGSAVTRAARISAAAGAGEILVSAELLAGCERTVPVAGERTLELKGIAEPLTAVLIAWSDESEVGSSAPSREA